MAKNKALISDYERQIKDLKLVRDDVSSKNDEIEGENSRLKKTIKEEGSKYVKLDTSNKELQEKYEELNNHHNAAIGQTVSLKSVIN